jgi:hypothetical protein
LVLICIVVVGEVGGESVNKRFKRKKKLLKEERTDELDLVLSHTTSSRTAVAAPSTSPTQAKGSNN